MSLHNRTITHKDLHPKTANQKELFHSASSLDWQPMTDHSRGMQSVIRKKFFGRIDIIEKLGVHDAPCIS